MTAIDAGVRGGLPPALSFASSLAEEDSAVEDSPLMGNGRSLLHTVDIAVAACGLSAGDGCDDDENATERAWTRRSQFPVAIPLALVGVLMMVSLGVMATVNKAGSGGVQEAARPAAPVLMTPRELFESPRFIDVATDNVISVSHGAIHHEHRAAVREEVGRQLSEISSDMWARYPEAAKKFDDVPLSPEEQEGFLTMMRSVGDHRLHRLGRDVGLFAHNSLSIAADGADAKLKIVDSLQPRIAHIRQLRDEVIPAAIRGPSGPAGASIQIDPDGVSFMKTFDRWNVELDVSTPELGRSQPARPRRLNQPAAGSSGGGPSAGQVAMKGMVKYAKLHRQAEAFFQQVQEFAAANYNVHIPNMDEAFRGVDTQGAMKCAMEAAMTMNPRAAMQCSMQFWAIAMDVMQNIAGGIGPVTTSTEQTKFASFDDLMS